MPAEPKKKNPNARREARRANWHARHRCHRITQCPVTGNYLPCIMGNAISYIPLFSRRTGPIRCDEYCEYAIFRMIALQ